MIAQNTYGFTMLCLMGTALYADGVDSASWTAADDLLANCAQVGQAFAQDAQELTSLVDAFENVCVVLNTITQQRQDTFNGYSQQLANYQNLLAQEQQTLALIQAQGVADQLDLQSQIDQTNQKGNEQIVTLKDSIASLQDAILTLQENLATIANLTQSRVDGVNAMVSSYTNFQDVRSTFKDQIDEMLYQIRTYIGTTAKQDASLMQ